jgi:ribulose-phosphate 3-epimerase
MLSDLIRARGLKVTIEVDGGIDENTASSVVQAGARLLVAGSAIFGRPDPVEAMGVLRTAATAETV